ncbi:unnamed protein product [Symbiodinium sp. CCMP2456]|nr:unnamed protein product [Symbiodinium sp. CCMP2456]
MDQPLPDASSKTILYLDNFDEIRHLKKEIAGEEAEVKGQVSENHGKFIEACISLGLPRNEGKQLCGALSGTLQGGEVLGQEKVLRHAYEKTVELLSLGLGLLVNGTMPECFLRHWTGKAAFAAAFRRPMYSILQEVYGVLETSRDGAHLALPTCVVDEVVVFSGLLALAETDLSSEISPEVSCTDASPTGGGCSVATAFKEKTLLLPDPVEDLNFSDCCQKELAEEVVACTRVWRGIATQPPLDYEVPGDRWDFKTEAGKARLDDEPHVDTLVPFMKDRSTAYWDRSGRWVEGAPQLRDRHHPEGLPKLKQHLNVAVRQANALAKRAARGLAEAKRRGTRECWVGVLHNSDSLHAVLHNPQCEGHDDLEDPDLGNEDEDSEYPWRLCLVMAEGIYDELNSLYSEPFGSLPLNLDRLLKHQLQGATRGLQQEEAVIWAVNQCATFLETMNGGEEKLHLEWLLQHAYHTGCDVRLTDRGDDIVGHRPGPYPAFRWHWKDVLSYQWREPQHINVLEMTAFLTELRRRARNVDALGKRFFCVIDSLVSFYVLGKGRSSSKRLNRVSRRIASLSLASGLIPMTLWTISKWNFSDGASRKYEPK